VKVVMRSFIYPFNKLKSGLKLEDKLPISSPGMRRSAWSYSYDLKLNQICQEAQQKATICDVSKSEVEDKSISRCNEDLENDFIFEGNLGESETEDVSYDGRENSQDHRVNKPGHNLESLTVDETEQSVDNVKRLRISNVQQQQSWLARTILPFPKDMGDSDEIKPTNKAKIDTQIQAIIDYLQQFIPNTALPSLKKLVMEHCREKMEMKKQIDFLKQKNSLLESELQKFKRAYRKAAKQLTNLKAFQSQKQSVVGRNFDMDKDSKVKLVENKKLTLSYQKYELEKEHTGVKFARYKKNQPEQEGNIEVNKDRSYEKKFLKINNTPRSSGLLSLKWKPFASRKISQDLKNKRAPNDRKKLNLGSKNFQKKFDMEAWSRNEALSIEKLWSMNPLKIKSPVDQLPLLKTTNYMSNESSYRDMYANFLKDNKSGWERISLCDYSKCIPCNEKLSALSLKVSHHNQSSQQLKENLSPKREILDTDALAFGNSRKRRNPEKPTNTENERILKVDKMEKILDLHKISEESTVQFLKQFRDCEGSSKGLIRSPTGIPIRSKWL